jgi:D-alanyl-D-alanine carboxypeptidase/D-alanyl-D-alanine-endopeptidase (penicillin-binding protein 4)
MHPLRILLLVCLSLVGASLPALAQVPTPAGRVVATSELDFDALLGPVVRDRLFKESKGAVEVVEVASGKVVFAKDADKPLIPASTMKVITAAAALRALGPAYRFSTDIYADAPIDAAGVLQGNLYVRGRGDPTFVVERMWKILADLRAEGLVQVKGDIVFDDTFFDQQSVMPGWNKEKDVREGPSYFSTSSALSLNHNTVTIIVAPGPEVGRPARVQFETPAKSYIQLDGSVSTGAPGSRRTVDIVREVKLGAMNFIVSGSVPSDDPMVRYYRTVADPTLYFMGAWADLADGMGIKHTGKYRRGVVPASARLIVQQRSSPLSTILMDMNKHSSNFIAEQVLKTIGAETAGVAGDVASGLRYIEEYLAEIGVTDPSVKLINGSGLSRDARLTASTINTVMRDMALDPRRGQEFLASLSLAGWDGTMWSRLGDDPGRVRGKTGTIDGVHGLCGYVTAADGRAYVFTFLFNDLRGTSAPARRLHDRMLRSLYQGAPH